MSSVINLIFFFFGTGKLGTGNWEQLGTTEEPEREDKGSEFGTKRPGEPALKRINSLALFSLLWCQPQTLHHDHLSPLHQTRQRGLYREKHHVRDNYFVLDENPCNTAVGLQQQHRRRSTHPRLVCCLYCMRKRESILVGRAGQNPTLTDPKYKKNPHYCRVPSESPQEERNIVGIDRQPKAARFVSPID